MTAKRHRYAMEAEGRRLRSIRQGTGLKLRDLAEYSGTVKSTTIGNWERGERGADFAVLRAGYEKAGFPEAAQEIERLRGAPEKREAPQVDTHEAAPLQKTASTTDQTTPSVEALKAVVALREAEYQRVMSERPGRIFLGPPAKAMHTEEQKRAQKEAAQRREEALTALARALGGSV